MVRVLPWGVLSALCAWHVTTLWDMFTAGRFQYHDLTLINDWFTNALLHGRPFWGTAPNSSHLTYNFTPSVILLAPFFAFVKSQFLLVLLGAVALHLAIGVVLHVFCDLAEEYIGPPAASVAAASLAVVCSLNIYTKTVLAAGHYEVFFALPCLLACRQLIGQRRPNRVFIGLMLALALGVRQDAGFYAFFFVGGLILVRPFVHRRSKEILVWAFLCLLYTVVCVKWIMPAWGYTGGLRFWTHYGDGPAGILATLLRDPGRLGEDLYWSALFPLNRSFSYFPVLHAYGWVANFPGIPLYMVSVADFGRRMLHLYNASFLLPGLFLGVAFAWIMVLRVMRRFVSDKRVRRVGFAVLGFGAILLVRDLLRHRDGMVGLPGDRYAGGSVSIEEAAARAWQSGLDQCAGARIVAGEPETIVFAPNLIDKVLLLQWRQADLIVTKEQTETGKQVFTGMREAPSVGGYRIFLGRRCTTILPSR